VRGVVAGATTRLLLRLAAKRWPPSIRDERQREWTAETHTLADTRRWGRMVGFALSLAVTRPSLEPRRAVPLDRRFWSTVAVLVLGPVAALVLGYVAMFLTALSVVGLVLLAGLLWRFGRLFAYAGASGVLVRGGFALPAVLLPGLAVALYLPELGVGGYRTLTRPTLVWAGLLTVVLIVVVAMPRPASWWLGYAGVVAVAWVAVTWAVWLYVEAGIPGGGILVDPAYAWLWFPASFAEIDLGPGPSGAAATELGAWWVVADFTEAYPAVLLALGVYAVGYLVGVREHREVPEPVRR
jgi:hypothetical protein